MGHNTYLGFEIAVLERCFSAVQNKEHWKGPIKARVLAPDLDATMAAIIYYTATRATVEVVCKGVFDITAPGYWTGPAC